MQNHGKEKTNDNADASEAEEAEEVSIIKSFVGRDFLIQIFLPALDTKDETRLPITLNVNNVIFND